MALLLYKGGRLCVDIGSAIDRERQNIDLITTALGHSVYFLSIGDHPFAERRQQGAALRWVGRGRTPARSIS